MRMPARPTRYARKKMDADMGKAKEVVKAKMRQIREHEAQEMMVAALRSAGFGVLETTAYRQKGPSGVDKGVPDLLVYHKVRMGVMLPIEVKRPGAKIKYSSPEQQALCEAGHVHVCQTSEEALERAVAWLIGAEADEKTATYNEWWFAIERVVKVLEALRHKYEARKAG